MQFRYRALWETFMSNYFKIGSVVQEMSFKDQSTESTDGDGCI